MSCFKRFGSLLLAINLSALILLCSVGNVQGQIDGGDLGGGFGDGAGADGGGGDDTGNVGIETSENTRNQGFVGATAPGIAEESENGFVGAVSENSGPDIVAGQSFGGGPNDFTPNSFDGADGESESFSVIRKSIRARLVPSFYSPPTPSGVVSSRFQNHFSRQPGSQFSGAQYSVTVTDRTAYIRGSVSSEADSERLERQLRLEPGVYRIVNELSVNR